MPEEIIRPVVKHVATPPGKEKPEICIPVEGDKMKFAGNVVVPTTQLPDVKKAQ